MDELLLKAAAELGMVLGNIDGRSADVSTAKYNTRLFAALAVMAGPGDVLEIGSYFGAASITAALLKKHEGIAGRVVCLDPLDGREQMVHNEPQTTGQMTDSISKQRLGPDVLLANAERNGAELELVAQPSQPFPAELAARRFTTTFIDGDHWHGAPLADWESVKGITTRYIIFDDADEGHPHVMEAVRAAMNDGDWSLLVQGASIAAFERKEPN